MANQVPQVDGCLASVVAPAGAGLYPHFAAAFPDAKWVWLRRDDVVSQAISRIMSQQTGINHATGTADQEHFAGNLARDGGEVTWLGRDIAGVKPHRIARAG